MGETSYIVWTDVGLPQILCSVVARDINYSTVNLLFPTFRIINLQCFNKSNKNYLIELIVI